MHHISSYALRTSETHPTTQSVRIIHAVLATISDWLGLPTPCLRSRALRCWITRHCQSAERGFPLSPGFLFIEPGSSDCFRHGTNITSSWASSIVNQSPRT